VSEYKPQLSRGSRAGGIVIALYFVLGVSGTREYWRFRH
jgi:hypothetical protein